MATLKQLRNNTNTFSATEVISREVLPSGVYTAILEEYYLELGYNKETKQHTDKYSPKFTITATDDNGNTFSQGYGYFGFKNKAVYAITAEDGSDIINGLHKADEIKRAKDNRALAESPLNAINLALLSADKYIANEDGTPKVGTDGKVLLAPLDDMDLKDELVTYKDGQFEKTAMQVILPKNHSFKVLVEEVKTLNADGTYSNPYNRIAFNGIVDNNGRNIMGDDLATKFLEKVAEQKDGVFIAKPRAKRASSGKNGNTNNGNTNNGTDGNVNNEEAAAKAAAAAAAFGA